MSTDFINHQLTDFCWCKPQVEELEGGHKRVMHFHRQLTYDRVDRARALQSEGAPV